MKRSLPVPTVRVRIRRWLAAGTLDAGLWLLWALFLWQSAQPLPSVIWTRRRGPEVEVQLPPFPQTEHLIPFVVSATTDNKFLIDSDSLTFVSGGLVRYTLVIISPSGAQNVSYEGMNCATGERRLYALGRPDQTWSRARSDQWIRVRENTLNRHHAELFTNYFCPLGIAVRDADEVRQALRLKAAILRRCDARDRAMLHASRDNKGPR
jgi:hypothetical protein